MYARTVSVLVLVLAVALGVWMASPAARADRSPLVEQAIAELATYTTLYGGEGTGGILQVDVAREVLTHDSSLMRVHWDGTHLYLHEKDQPAPVELPAEWEDRVRQVWDEWRAGFPNTSFVPDSPVAFDAQSREWAANTWYRVDLPFPWMRPYLVYVQVMNGGIFGYLAAYHADTHEPVSLGLRWSRDYREMRPVYLRRGILRPGPGNANVPLSPETYSPVRPAQMPGGGWPRGAKSGLHGEYDRPTWHQLQQYVVLVRTDGQGSLTAGPQLSKRCDTAPAVHKEPLEVAFALPDDPDRRALAVRAAAACPNAAFTSSLTVFHHAMAGQRTCARVRWRVVDTSSDPDVVLWHKELNECRTGPDDAQLHFPTDLPLAGVDPSGLVVELHGEATITCTAVPPPGPFEAGNVLAGFRPEGVPTLTWPGCFP